MRPKTISDEEILEVVRTCVLNEGPAVSTQIIAEQVGVSQATLFKRFGNKVHLISRALLLGVQAPNLIRSLEADVDRDQPEKQLFEMATQLQAFFEKMVPCWSALRSAGIEPPESLPKEAPPVQIRLALENWIRTLQHEGIARDTEHPETIAIAMIGALQTRSFRRHIIRDIYMTQSDEEYVKDLVSLTWRALSKKEES